MERDLATSYMYCEACGGLTPEDELTIDVVTGKGRCDTCWNRVGRSYEEMLAAGELPPEEIAA
jgi:hypothetical protein